MYSINIDRLHVFFFFQEMSVDRKCTRKHGKIKKAQKHAAEVHQSQDHSRDMEIKV